MLFNSFVFVAFLAIVLPLYYGLSHRWQNRMLVVASYVFYGFWDWRFCSLLLLSTLVDYSCGLALSNRPAGQRRNILLVSLAVNLGVLGFFKYFNFFVDSFRALLEPLGLAGAGPALDIVLPVGISFYTFQTLAYTIDVYRGRQEATRDFTGFALYVSFFPQLVAGPIERSTHLLPQLQKVRRVDNAMLASGAQLMLMGYVKKVGIADAVAPYVNPAFADPGAQSAGTLLFSLYLFALQIYCDFSGYSDIARGVSRLLGIDLMINFKQPYLSRDITEFWRRWHISLSTWLRDYLYIPLGGNRVGSFATYRNLMLTMLLGGLWHGAAWTFVVWGGLHGLYLAVHRRLIAGRRRPDLPPAPAGPGEWSAALLRMVLTFNLVCLTWIFFRADTFPQAWAYLTGIVAGDPSLDFAGRVLAFAFFGGIVLLLDVGCWLEDRELPIAPTLPVWVRGVVYAAAFLFLSFVGESDVAPFIYFQF